MKKHLSVFELTARSSVHKILIISLLMSAAELFLFHLKLKEAMKPYIYGVLDFKVTQLENLADSSMISWIFVIGFILITLVLISHGCESNTKSIYTYQRLLISEKDAFFCQAAYNTVAYIIFWAVQAITFFFLCLWYTKIVPSEFVGNQTVFLAFYRSDLLHSVMPMSEVSLWIRNFILALSLGFAAAEFPFKQRRKKFGVTVLALAMYTVIFFSREFGSGMNTFFMILVSVSCLGEAIYTVYKYWNTEVSEDEK